MPYHQFPKDFLWGAATASYQIEGAVNEDGRGPSIWDTMSHAPGRIHNGDTGDVACDHYHRWREDVDMMAEIGLKAYRFSLAWPRIIPDGTGAVNEKGLDFYDRLIDALLEKHIQPMATLYHWDLPQALEDAGGWRVRSIVPAFGDYASVVARRFGDRVKLWCTINEPWCVWWLGHCSGDHAPGRKDPEKVWRNVAHHVMMAHGAGVQALRSAAPGPVRAGIVPSIDSVYPLYETDALVSATRKEFRRRNAWLLDPLYRGYYPEDLWEELSPENRPDVRPEDFELITEKTDFLGLNVYASSGVVDLERGGVRKLDPAFPRTDMSWAVTPDSLYWSLRFTHEIWKPGDLFITENGCAYPRNEQVADDYARVHFLQQYLRSLHRTTAEGLPVRGYFLWSLLDNFEWAEGYSKRFGIVDVDYPTGRRTPRASARWYSQVIRNNGL